MDEWKNEWMNEVKLRTQIHILTTSMPQVVIEFLRWIQRLARHGAEYKGIISSLSFQDLYT